MGPAKIALFILVSGAASLAACANANPEPGEGKLKALTAEAVAGVDAASVEISQFTRKAAVVTWRATAGVKVYDCSADNSFRLPSCDSVS